MKNITYNLLDKYEITVIDNKINWVGACEEYPQLEDGTYSDQVNTLYVFGEGEVVGRILILYTYNDVKSTTGDSKSFYGKLKELPFWNKAPWYIQDGNLRLPSVQYSNSGRNVALDEALHALKMAGYIWNPEIEGFDRKKKEERTVNILNTAHFQELVKSNDQTLTQ